MSAGLDTMLIRDLFASDVTRDIPPVVYFHEQSPAKLAAEVSEYIITGGWDQQSSNHRSLPRGIHEEYVRLLRAIAADMGKTDLPTVWVSGFYGSGKSSFAKLLGLALDKSVELPNGTPLAQAWLARDTSDRKHELREAWDELQRRLRDPVPIVFDIGASARDKEHVHAVILRQVQRRLGYCSTEPLVADFELKLERDGEWDRFQTVALATIGRPWHEVKDKALAEEEFSAIMAAMYPDRYTDPMSWFTSRGGTHWRSESPEEAVIAIRDMVAFRRPEAELFLVVDEVSQYVLSNPDRFDRLRAFATALGATLKGKTWLIAIGQQKLDESATDPFLIWAKGRFPDKLRVHLADNNIRDVIHHRLLRKTPVAADELRKLFRQHRPDLTLYAHECTSIDADEFVDVYPLLPSHIHLILRITSAMRVRSKQMQGDDQAIRGLLQLLGELFRTQKLATAEVGALVTLDKIYDVQHTALDSDTQASMARVLSRCAKDDNEWLIRAAKVVALLELIQDTVPTDARLVAQCLYDRVDRGNNIDMITEALEELRRRNLLGYTEKQGYKIQSSAGEEWERERSELIDGSGEAISEAVQAQLRNLLGATPEAPKLEGRPFPWTGVFSDDRRANDVSVLDRRVDACFLVDFRLRPDRVDPSTDAAKREEAEWVRRSSEDALRDRLVWVVAQREPIEDIATELLRSLAMVRKYKPRRESLALARQFLLQHEEARVEDHTVALRKAVATAWMDGAMYFRGRVLSPRSHGREFGPALTAAATRLLPELFPHFDATTLLPAELLQLIEPDHPLSGISPKFLPDALGIFEVESKRYIPTCNGVTPRRIEDFIKSEPNPPTGAVLLSHFGAPPFGFTVDLIKACVAGLLRAGRLRIQPEGSAEITAIRDAGVRDLFDKDRSFRRATIAPVGADAVSFSMRARIAKFFEECVLKPGEQLEREDHAIADAVSLYFPDYARELRSILDRLNRLPGPPPVPAELIALDDALEQCVRSSRQTRPTVQLVKRHLTTLRDGVRLIRSFDKSLSDAAICKLREARETLDYHLEQLRQLERIRPTSAGPKLQEVGQRLAQHLGIERPWIDIEELDHDVAFVRGCYVEQRQALLQWQEQQAEQARAALERREGFAGLGGEQAHDVLRPFAAALDDTPTDAIAPSLLELADPFVVRLQRASAQANTILDRYLSTGAQPPVRAIDLRLQNREIASEAEVEAVVDEIRQRLLEQVRAGVRVRLV